MYTIYKLVTQNKFQDKLKRQLPSCIYVQENFFKVSQLIKVEKNVRGNGQSFMHKFDNTHLNQTGDLLCAFMHNEWAKTCNDACVTCAILGTLRFIGRQRDGNGKKTLYDMCLQRTQVAYYQSY